MQQSQQHHQPHPYVYHHAPPIQMNNKCRQPAMQMKNSERKHCGGPTLERPADGGVLLNRNFNRSVINEGTPLGCRSCSPPAEEGSMTHDEAMRICTLMGSPGKKGFQYAPANDLLQNVLSFDFVDNHSLSTDHGDIHRSDSLLDEVEAQEEKFIHDQASKNNDNILDLSELLPLELGEGDAFSDLLL
jgi:hypothetical protein